MVNGRHISKKTVKIIYLNGTCTSYLIDPRLYNCSQNVGKEKNARNHFAVSIR